MKFTFAPRILVKTRDGSDVQKADVDSLSELFLFVCDIGGKFYLGIQTGSGEGSRLAVITPEKVLALMKLPDTTTVSIDLDRVQPGRDPEDKKTYWFTVQVPTLGSFPTGLQLHPSDF